MLLDALTARLIGDFVFVGIAVAQSGEVQCATACLDDRQADDSTLFRTASISKIVVGQTFAAVARRAGFRPPFAQPAQDILGWPLIHPSGVPITLGQLASHSAGITDIAGYTVPPDQRLADWIVGQGGAIFGAHPPGTYMCYSNLGYILLAACIEVLAGDRFDRLAQTHVLGPLGVSGGFNWSGVSAAQRADALPTYRWDGATFVPQIDSTIAPTGVVAASGEMMPFEDDQPGRNPAIFSPQGGLRLSLDGMLALACAIPQMDQTVLWDHRNGPGDYLDGLMQDYGLGLQILRTPPFYPRPLVGHFANAYGFKGGVWYDAATDTTFAYALNGAPMGDESDLLSGAERQILHTISELD